MQKCHAMLVPLRDHPLLEAFIPSKLYDAMAVARPAIVAARGEAADLVREARAGIAVPPEDGAALAKVIRQLANDPATAHKLGAAGRQAAQSTARSRQVERLDALLRAVVRGPR